MAGVVLFADNFPSRAAGRRWSAACRRSAGPPALRDPLLVMVDQEGGLVKRLGGAPTASAAEMGERGAAFSRAQGRARPPTCASFGVNVDLAPVLDVARPGGTIAETERGFGSTAPQVAATAVPFAAGLQSGRRRRHRQALPGPRRGAKTPTSRCSGSTSRSRTLRDVDEAPYRAFVAAGGDMVMLSTAIYPAFSAVPPPFPGRSRPGSCASGWASRASRSPTRSTPSPCGPSAARRRPAWRPPGRAPTCCSSPTSLRAETARRALVAQLRAETLDRAEFEASAQRVLDLRPSWLGPSGAIADVCRSRH